MRGKLRDKHATYGTHKFRIVFAAAIFSATKIPHCAFQFAKLTSVDSWLTIGSREFQITMMSW